MNAEQPTSAPHVNFELRPGQVIAIRRGPQPRLCAWCMRKPVESRGGKYCSHSCRQRAYEYRRRIEQLLAMIERADRHLHTLHAMLTRTLAERHIINARVQEEPPNV